MNNETFTVKHVDHEYIYVSSERCDDNGETYENDMEANIGSVQKLFYLN